MRIFEVMYPKDFHDGRNVTSEMLREISTSFQKGSKIPIAKGHSAAIGFMNDSQPAEGWVKGVKFRDDNEKLYAKVDLLPEMDEAYKQGKYASWSVGVYSKKIRDENGEVEGREPWQLGHLAMLGATEAAFKDLQEVDGFEFSFNVDKYKKDDECITYSDGETDWLMFSNSINEIEDKPSEKSDNNSNDKITTKKEDLEMKDKETEKEVIQAQEFAALKAERDQFAKEKQEYESILLANTMQIFDSKNENVLNLAAEKGISKDSEIGKKISVALDSEKENYKLGEEANYKVSDAFEAVFNHLKAPVSTEEVELKEAEEGDTVQNFMEAAKNRVI